MGAHWGGQDGALPPLDKKYNELVAQ